VNQGASGDLAGHFVAFIGARFEHELAVEQSRERSLGRFPAAGHDGTAVVDSLESLFLQTSRLELEKTERDLHPA